MKQEHEITKSIQSAIGVLSLLAHAADQACGDDILTLSAAETEYAVRGAMDSLYEAQGALDDLLKQTTIKAVA